MTYAPGRRYECFVIDLKVTDPETAKAVAEGGAPLRSLCQKEVSKFEDYLREYGGEYGEGLARFERLAIEGYIYQKVRGHFDGQEKADLSGDPREHEDGATTSP